MKSPFFSWLSSTACLERVVVLTAVLVAGGSAPAETVSLILSGAVWRYDDTGVDRGTAWRAPAFNDNGWSSGPAQLGFGDYDEATQLTAGYVTYYFRHRFALTNASAISNLTTRLVYDDGAVVYVNGVETFRVAMPTGPITNATLALGVVPDNAVYEASLSPGLLVNGTNVVAVEVHQANLVSTDLSFDFQLVGNTAPVPPSPGIFHFETPSSVVSEGFPARTILVSRSVNTEGPASVEYFTRDQTATAGQDYVATNGVLQFASGESNKTFAVTILDDSLDESNETVLLVLTNAQGATLPGGGPMLTATLTIVDNDPIPVPPVITEQPVSQTRFIGEDVTFTVEATGTPPLSYQWFSNDEPIPGATNATLTLTNVQVQDADYYEVCVRNAAGLVYGWAMLNVIFTLADALDTSTLVWRTDDTDPWEPQTQTTHDSVDAAHLSMCDDCGSSWLETDVTGPGLLSYWWKMLSTPEDDHLVFSVDGVQLAALTGVVEWSRESIVVPPGTHTLQWSYSTGDNGTEGLNAAWLDEVSFTPGEFVPPRIIQQPSDQTRFAGQTATFSVVATGTPPLACQWQYYGTPIAGATNATLTLNHLQLSQGGGYTVVIANAVGTVTSAEATLAVFPAPTGPGSLDLTFDPTRAGEVIGPASESGEVVALARQPDGKLVIGGQFSGYNGSLRRHIARIHPNGVLDEGFNPGLGVDGHVYAVALKPDGQVLVGGSFSVFDTQPCSSLVRLHPNGSLDTGFSATVTRYGVPGSVNAIVVQGDGKILVGGSFSEVNGVARTNVARLHPDGSLDAGFVPASAAPDWYQGVVSLAVLPDGKLLVGGRFLGGGKLLCRLHPDGSLDSSFATELTGYGLIQSGVRSDGKIYAVGQFDVDRPGWNYSRLMLLNADGTIDPEFVVHFDNDGFYCFAALAVQPDDRVLVSGWFHSVNNVLRDQVARLNPDGSLDESFDPGDTLGEWSPTSDARAMVLEPDGYIWLGGLVSLADGSQVALVRLQPNGQFDEAFYTEAGEVNVAGHNISIQALAALPDGRVYVGGAFDSFNNQPRANLARLLPDGTLDNSYDPAWSNRFEVSLLTLQPDGKLLAGGSIDLVRFNPDGSLDPSFVGHLHDTLGMRIRCLALQADGKIVLGGEFADGLARLNADGSLDDTFHPPYLPAYDGDAVQALAMQPDGKILFGGNGAIGFQRLLPDGSVDASFNCDGVIGHVFNILLQSDGSILIGGRPCLTIGSEARGLARLHPDGRVDGAFNAPLGDYVDQVTVALDGRILVTAPEDVGGWPSRIYRLDSDGSVDAAFQARLGPVYGPPVVADILVQSDGQVLIGGTFTAVNGIPVDGLARLNSDLTVLTPFVQRAIAAEGTIRLAATPLAQVSVYAVEDQPPAGWPVSNISHDGVFDVATGKVKFGPFYDHEPRTLSYEVMPPIWGVHCALGVFCFNGQASADGVNSLIGGQLCLALAGYFPADVNPANRQISIEEVTAYGAAWRRGSNWLCHAQGIPINYVTRAGMLWRAGECYAVDSTITDEPLWWVPCEGGPTPVPDEGQAGGLSYSGAVRSVPSVFVPGEPTTVTISTAPDNNVRAYAVEDALPAGWTVSACSHNGEFDPVGRKVKWGPFLDRTARTLSYQARPPATCGGVAGFVGSASFDGTGLAISGPRQSWASGRVVLVQRAGGLALSLTGADGARFAIESSANLTEWTLITEVTLTGASVSVPLIPSSVEPQRFYRARLIE